MRDVLRARIRDLLQTMARRNDCPDCQRSTWAAAAEATIGDGFGGMMRIQNHRWEVDGRRHICTPRSEAETPWGGYGRA